MINNLAQAIHYFKSSIIFKNIPEWKEVKHQVYKLILHGAELKLDGEQTVTILEVKLGEIGRIVIERTEFCDAISVVCYTMAEEFSVEKKMSILNFSANRSVSTTIQVTEDVTENRIYLSANRLQTMHQTFTTIYDEDGKSLHHKATDQTMAMKSVEDTEELKAAASSLQTIVYPSDISAKPKKLKKENI